MMNRQPVVTQKPEYVLKRVNELINSAVGSNAEKEKRLALEQLHSVLSVKRKGIWTKVYESLMKRHLELCVDLKDHLTAKDGLHQYRNLCQTIDPSSLEVVINHLMELAEARATAARLKADKVAIVAAARVSDLDQEETPESIMLSSMTEEVAKDRTDREVVVPWLKFLWESYRAILELLYKIPKLEKAYHSFCEKAFKFCLEYNRVLEFKRLCDTLRMQLTNLQKAPAATARVRTQWEWTPEAVELHLKTRFAQLEGATTLELWNEGFRTVEDIYAIMVASKKSPKAKLMMTYYDKLQRIFWVSDNKLLHAYSWFRYYNLCVETKKDLKAEEKSVLASSMLLAALSVPSTRDIYSFGDEEEEVVEKGSQMALLLDFQTNPSRQSLLGEIVAKGYLADALPELAALYDNLEVKFQPLNLVKKITAAVAVVKAHPTLNVYAAPLQRVAVVKLMQQLGRVYSTVKLDFVYKLLAGLGDLKPTAIERILIEGVAAKQLQLRVHHSTGAIHFGSSASTTSFAMDTQVSQLGAQLNKVSQSISLLLGQKTLEAQKAAARKEFMRKVADASEEEYLGSLDRKAQIERRKEEMERVQAERQKEEQRRKDEEAANRKEEEARRLVEEENERNAEKRRKAQEKMEILRMQKELEKYSVFVDETALTEMGPAGRRAMLTNAQDEAQKAKEEEGRKVTEQARRQDHITRALRIEAAGHVEKLRVRYAGEDEADYQEYCKNFFVGIKTKHETDLVEKARLSRMQGVRDGFEAKILASQKAAHEKLIAKEKAKALKHRTEQIIAKARRLYYEAQERAEMEEEKERERLAKEERARIELEEYERLRISRERAEAAEKEREERVARERAEAEEARLQKEEELKNTPTKAAYVPFGRGESAGADPRGQRPGPAGGGDRDWGRGDRGGDRPAASAGGGDRWGGRDARDGGRDNFGPRGGDRDGGRDAGRDAGRDFGPRGGDRDNREGGPAPWRGSTGPPPRDNRDARDNAAPEGDRWGRRPTGGSGSQQSRGPPAPNSRASGGW
uniref:PCI domain-containing protein n=1 Tax=Spumella elongata TaxID=89044 RepID=A0A7S3HP73_9STRA|mmetsp:Transcript_62657/g.110601  ORF Transcript_62657/g.110601 Transcript_62657/m.110601 type:complete len:1027 (+) Transcript_62657:97-3177(+)